MAKRIESETGMNAATLIEILQKLPPDAKVKFTEYDTGGHCDVMSVEIFSNVIVLDSE